MDYGWTHPTAYPWLRGHGSIEARPELFKAEYRPQQQFRPLRHSAESRSKRCFGPLGLEIGLELCVPRTQQLPASTRAAENNSHRPTGCGPLSALTHTPAQLQPQRPLRTNIIVAGSQAPLVFPRAHSVAAGAGALAV